MNKELKQPDAGQLQTMENTVHIKNTFFNQGDYIGINSIRVNDMFYGDG